QRPARGAAVRHLQVRSRQSTVRSLEARGRRSTVLVVFFFAVSLLLLTYATPEPQLPSFAAVRAAYRPSDVPLLDRFGEVIHELRVDTLGRRLPWTPLSEVSPALRATVLTSEDRRFYRHSGVDPLALISAALDRLRGRPLRGASTISLPVTTLLAPAARSAKGRKALAQKWRQMRLAWALERHWSKSQILEAYMNLVTFRGEIQGVAAAARVLFGKAPHGITAAEAAVLAVLLRAPNAGQDAVTRRARALQEARGQTAGEVSASVTSAFHSYSSPGPRVASAPHAARRLLQPAETFSPARSTLNGALQRFAAETLRRHLLGVRAQHV